MADPNTTLKEAQEKDAQWYNKLGAYYSSKGQYKESIEYHQKVVSIANGLELNVEEGKAYFGIAQANNRLNNVVEAIEYYNKCITALEGEEDEGMVKYAYCDIGACYLSIKSFSKSIECFQKSLKLAEIAADTYIEMLSCFNLGKSNVALNRYEEAISCYERAFCIAKGRGDLKFSEKTACFLGDTYMLLERPHEALKHHKQTLEYSLQLDNKEIQKTLFLKLGLEYKAIHGYPNAVEYFQKYQKIAKLTGDKKGEVDGYSFLGRAYCEMNKYEAALDCFQNSLRIARGMQSKELENDSHQSIASAYNKLGKYQQTIEHFEKSLNFHIEKGDRKGEYKCYLDIVKAYLALGRLQEGKTFLNHCLLKSVEIVEKGDRSSAYEYLGEAYYLLGEFKEAKQYYEMLLDISVELGNKLDEVEAINYLGVIYKKFAYYAKAIKCFEKTLQFAVENGRKVMEANVLCNLGHVFTTVGRYEEAFDILCRGLNIAMEVGDIFLQGTAHIYTARIHHVLANNQEEVNHAKMCIEIAKKSSDKKCEELVNRAAAMIANVDGDFNTVLKTAKKQVELTEKSSNKYEHVCALLKLGKAYFVLGNYEDARKYIEKSLDVGRETETNFYDFREAYEYLGYVNERLFEVDSGSNKAFHFHEKHLQLAREIGHMAGIGRACENLGRLYLLLYLKQKSPEYQAKAECYLKESLRSNDLVFQDLGEEDEYKINVIETQISTHKLLVELYIETGELEKALLVSEQERGRALEDILKGRYMLDDAKIPTYDSLGYSDIENKVLSPDTCILFFSDTVKTKNNFELQVGTWVLDVENHVSFFSKDLQQIKALLQESVRDEDVQKNEDEVLDALVDKAFLTISVQRSVDSEDRSFSMHGRNSAGSVTLQDSHKRCVYDEELNENYLEVLYDTLIAPVQDKLIHEEIIIIPDGSLFKVPFAALRNREKGVFLSDTKRLRIAPSLNTLKIMKESSAESHSLTGALIVGDPDVDGKRILRGKERSFHSLPNARLEAERIGKVLGVEALTGKQASKQVFIERLRQGVAVIHLAAHGCAETGEIILSPSADHPTDKIPKEEDYLLTINEVQQVGLRARLVVLSCCHSGRGKIKSEGVIGMSRAFLAAGALAVVASLWAVDDEGTRVFMEQFYTHLKQGKTASTSLQQAMKDMRDMPRFNKPMYWAPFVLIGDDVTINID